MIKEGRETRPPRNLAMSDKAKGKVTLGPAPALPEVDTQSPPPPPPLVYEGPDGGSNFV